MTMRVRMMRSLIKVFQLMFHQINYLKSEEENLEPSSIKVPMELLLLYLLSIISLLHRVKMTPVIMPILMHQRKEEGNLEPKISPL